MAVVINMNMRQKKKKDKNEWKWIHGHLCSNQTCPYWTTQQECKRRKCVIK